MKRYGYYEYDPGLYPRRLWVAVGLGPEDLEGQERENFENGVFQYEGMVCGMVEEINFERKWFLAPFKAPGWNQVLTLAIDYCEADLSKFHCVKSVQGIDFYRFLKIKEQDIIDIIKNKDYD